jgi:HK97 family phage major capsid protein
MLNTVQMRQDRAKIIAEMRAVHDGIVERGEETPEETEKLAKMEKDTRALEHLIEREEMIQKEERELAQTLDEKRQNGNGVGGRFEGIQYPTNGLRQPNREEVDRRASIAVQGWLRAMKPGNKILPEHEEACRYFGFTPHTKEVEIPLVKDYRSVKREYRDMSLTAGSGGVTVPEGFVSALEQALLAFGGMRQVADVIRTDGVGDLPWPTMNDTANKGAILAEATTFSTSVDPTFSSVVFKAFKYSSKPIIVSNELLQDSAFDLAAMVGGWLGTRIARIQNDHFTTGTGTSLPMGIVVAATEGVEATSKTAVTDAEIITQQHKIDPAYRPNAQWMFHDTILAAIRALKDSSTGQYLWQPGMQAGVPDRLLGHTYVINQSMASAQAQSAKIILFGDFSKYKIRDVAAVRMVRLDELFAQTDQVGFVAFLRSDGNLLDAGTNPVKYLINHKT